MITFLLKISVFFGLWVGIFTIGQTDFSITNIAIASIIIALYYVVSVAPYPLFIYSVIQSLTVILYVYGSSETNAFLLLLFMFFAIEALFQLKNKIFLYFTIYSILILTILSLIEFKFAIETVLYLLFFFLVAYVANDSIQERENKKELYVQLLSEYRTVKRAAYLAEKEVRYEERTKIARDIHDAVGHKLTALLMQIQILSIQNGPEHYDQLKKLADESLQETRKAVKALSNEEHEGISTILQLIKKLESESHIQVHFTTKAGILSSKLTNQESVVLYRVIQEGLTNAMRHAQSREVQIILGKTAIGEVEFSITNAVHHLDSFQEGFGLKNMRERLQAIGGNLHIVIAEHNFIVKGSFPLQEIKI